jgi:hypothetical protein
MLSVYIVLGLAQNFHNRVGFTLKWDRKVRTQESHIL